MEPLSPELVLVSSDEDRRRAIEALPPLPWQLVQVPDRRVPPPYPKIVIEYTQDDVPPERTRRRVPWRLALATAALAAVGAVGYLSETRWHEARPTLAATPARSETALQRVQPTLGVAAQQLTAPPSSTTAPRAPQATVTRAARTPPATTVAAPRTVADAKPAASPPAVGFVPARTWAWVPKEGATSYEVTFFLDGRVVFRASAKEPRLAMPTSFRYRAGRYRWTVQAEPAQQNDKLLVDSGFVLTAAGAAAANGS